MVQGSTEYQPERRKWILDINAQEVGRYIKIRSETSDESETRFQAQKAIVQYYIKSPPTFYLSILVASRNVVNSDGTSMWKNIDQEARDIIKRERDPNLPPYPDKLYDAPGVVTAGAPITVRIQPNAPFEYVIGRNQQNLEDVPVSARRWFSRRHCAIQAYFGKKGKAGQAVFALKDLGSSNGSYLNGKILAGQGTVPLMNNDVIGVSMTDEGGLMLGFRFQVVAMNERRWASDTIREIPLKSRPLSKNGEQPSSKAGDEDPAAAGEAVRKEVNLAC